MDKNSNFYRAIEQAIINPGSEELNSIPYEPHEFSEEYQIQIASITEEKKNDNRAGIILNRKKNIKMSARTISIIASAALLAGTVTVTASESARQWVKKLFTFKPQKSIVSQVESQPVETLPLITQPTTAYTDIIQTTLPESETSLAETTFTVMTSTTTSTSTLTTIEPKTPVSTIITEFIKPIYPLYNNNPNQHISQYESSVKPSIIVTMPPKEESNISMSTTVANTATATTTTTVISSQNNTVNTTVSHIPGLEAPTEYPLESPSTTKTTYVTYKPTTTIRPVPGTIIGLPVTDNPTITSIIVVTNVVNVTTEFDFGDGGSDIPEPGIPVITSIDVVTSVKTTVTTTKTTTIDKSTSIGVVTIPQYVTDESIGEIPEVSVGESDTFPTSIKLPKY